MDRLLPSLRYTFRLLFKSPGFTITAVLILGLGIGVNTAIFSLIDGVLLKPLPFPNPDRLVQITEPYQNDLGTNIDYPDYIDIVRSQRTFDAIAVAGWDGIDLSGDGKPEHLNAVFVSPSAFQVTGLPVVLGRVFTDQERGYYRIIGVAKHVIHDAPVLAWPNFKLIILLHPGCAMASYWCAPKEIHPR
jgi:hypothetical protein